MFSLHFKKIILFGGIALFGLSYCNGEFLGSGDRITASTSTSTTLSGNLICVQNGGTNWTNDKVVQGNNEYKRTSRFSLMCFNGEITIVPAGSNSLLTYELINGPDLNPTCPTCPSQYTSLECQTEYNLIPLSAVNQSYCVNNGLCPSSDCPVNTGDIQWSALYINQVQHLGAPVINIDIPSEISRDYVNGSDSFDLTIDGYNVDTEYMDSLLAVQNYTPTDEDFVNLITNGLPKFGILLFVCLFVILIFYMIKKIF